jgi:S1-C subfamily serine protease
VRAVSHARPLEGAQRPLGGTARSAKGAPRQVAAALALLGAGTACAQAPSFETRQQVLRTLVQVTASDCADGVSRSGSGFALEQPGRIVTAHHVVGGCRTVQVSYEAVKPPAPKKREARIVRVLAAGDLSLLQIDAPPAVPTLRLAPGKPVQDQVFAGFGYALGMPTAGDQEVRFSTGATRLLDILPPAAADELRASGSPIAPEREVLRFNVALQPGMSGGPIVNAAGEVIGVVAGGLKAGAAPASWGWPGDGVKRLLTSTEPTDRAVKVASTYYSLPDLSALLAARQQGRRLRCGELEFTDTGTRSLNELMRGADDWPRVQYLLGLTRENPQLLAAESFRVWVSQPSGATVLMPPGAQLQRDGEVCVARSADGAFQQLVWSAVTPTPAAMQARSLEFEQRILTPRVPAAFNFQLDTNLTTFSYPNVPGPLMRPNGMLFNRKGFSYATQPQRFPGEAVPFAHLFLTLATGPGSFLGVATVNARVHPFLQACAMNNTAMQGCIDAAAHQRTWTRFVLATQLSTFPAY